ncbi:MAG: nitroreductase family protein [Oscillospiraceae bacterium]
MKDFGACGPAGELPAYDNRPVERKKLLRCLEAARLAPSACNSQPWHFGYGDRARRCARRSQRPLNWKGSTALPTGFPPLLW